MQFVWDPDKATASQRAHGIDFAQAVDVFQGPTLELMDERGAGTERRFIAIGEALGRIVVVVYNDEDGKRRVLSVRPANSKERETFRKALD